MTNLKKIGLTALAGSLVAVSANAGSMSVSGTAKVSYTNEDHDTLQGSPFGMEKYVSFSGSGDVAETDMSVSLFYSMLLKDSPSASTAYVSLDMGDMGVLKFNQDTGALGADIIDDVMPTAGEEIWDGLTSDAGRIGSTGSNGFNWTLPTMVDGLVINAAYAKGGAADDGGSGSTDGSDRSFAAVYTGIENLNIGFGHGTNSDTTNDSDSHQTMYAKYTFGNFEIGAATTEVDFATNNSTADEEGTQFGIAYNVNENLSISYGERETDITGTALDEEISGIAATYTMGGMALKFHANEVENLAGAAASKDEHTEISVTFAF